MGIDEPVRGRLRSLVTKAFEHVTEDLDHDIGRGRLVVAQHRLDVLVPVVDEDRLALLAGHRGHIDPLDRRLLALLGQLRVGIADVARDDVVEPSARSTTSSTGPPTT
jgi:hypothetical protein